MPVAGDDPVVAPVITQVRPATAQLSPVVGLVVATEAVQPPMPALAEMLAGQVIVGSRVSEIVTVNVQVAVLLAASRTV